MRKFFVSFALLLVGVVAALGSGGYPPRIAGLSFPEYLPTPEAAQGRLRFEDPDGDIAMVRFAVVDGRFVNQTLPVPVHAPSGEVSFALACTPFPQQVTLQATLYDRAGNASEAHLFSFTCGEPPRYDYDEVQAEVHPIEARIPINFVILADGLTLLAEGAWFFGALGEPAAEVREAIATALLTGLEGIWDQCGLGFKLGAVVVLDPAQLWVAGRPLAGQLFNQHNGNLVLRADSRSGNLLGQALQMIEALLKRQGQALNGLNVFITGRPVIGLWRGRWREVEGFSWQNPPYALVRWSAIAHTPGGFYKPKQVTATLAHEIGHLLGLAHPEGDGLLGTKRDRNNLMWGSGVTPSPRAHLLPEQCAIVRQGLAQFHPPRGAVGREARPQVKFLKPQGERVPHGKVTIRVRGEGFTALAETGLAQFEYSRDGSYYEPLGFDRDGRDGFSIVWDTSGLPTGEYRLRATLVDGRGQSATAEKAITIED